MDIKISFRAKVVGFGYRRADVRNVIMTFEADYQDTGAIRKYQKLHSELARKAGIMADNHQTFVVQQNDKQMVLRFSDYRIYVGTEYVIGIW